MMLRSAGTNSECVSTLKLLSLAVLLGIVSLVLSCTPQSEHKILRVWQTETDQAAVNELHKLVADFEKAHPDFKVQLESVAWSSLSSKLAVAIQGRNEPDVAHLEPFMVASLVNRNLLLAIDDVIADIEKANNDKIYEGVRNLQRFNGTAYGIAYAVGTTGWAYRSDLAKELGLVAPGTWTDFVNFARALHAAPAGSGVILLPGGDPFFIDQFFAELVANNGGRLFDPITRRPLLTSAQVIQALEFLRDIAPYIDPAWKTQRYLDQFHRFGRGEAVVVPVTYARAAKAIEQTVNESRSDTALKATPEFFAVMPQPNGPSFSGPSIATIDCEPFVIFRSATERGNHKAAKDFLRMFYDYKYYMPFVKAVPIHLTPIFEGMASSTEYAGDRFVSDWKQWADHTSSFLNAPERLRPILMPDVSERGRELPFLLEFQAAQILTKAVADVVSNGKTPEEAARQAQKVAERLVRATGYANW